MGGASTFAASGNVANLPSREEADELTERVGDVVLELGALLIAAIRVLDGRIGARML